MTKSYCKPFRRGVSWRSQHYAANKNRGANGPGGHTGIDEAAPVGTPVHAAGDGVVVYAGTFDSTYADNLLWLLDFGGNILVLDCGDDEPTFVYAHLQNFRVKPGDRVRKGQVIANSGNTGTRTTGAHLHVEAIAPGYVLHSPTLGRVNPDLYLTEGPEDLPTITTQGTTKGFLMALNDKQQEQLAADVAYIRTELAPIKTSDGPVSFRQFFANGVRAAEEARDNTAAIDAHDGKVSIRTVLAQIWRK